MFDRTRVAVSRQLKGMGCSRFEVGIRHPERGMLLRILHATPPTSAGKGGVAAVGRAYRKPTQVDESPSNLTMNSCVRGSALANSLSVSGAFLIAPFFKE